MEPWLTWQFTPLALPQAIACGLSLLGASLAWRYRRAAKGAVWLWRVLAAAAFWALLGALEFSVVSLHAKTCLSQLSYLGVVLVPFTLYSFTYAYTHEGRDPPKAVSRGLLFAAFGLFLAVSTNGLHRLVWVDVVPIELYGFQFARYERGPLFWVNIAYCYGLMTASTVAMMRYELRLDGVFRQQNWMALAAVFAPWLTSAAYLLRIGPFGEVDHTPVGFAVSGLAMSWAVIRLRLFDLQPMAAETLFDRMPDPVLAIDASGRLVRYNPAAAYRFGFTADDSGKPVSELLKGLTSQDEALFTPDAPEGLRDLWFKGTSWAVQTSLLKGERDIHFGRMFVLRDVTSHRQNAEALLSAKRAVEQALHQANAAVAEARAASSAKSVFLAQVSHDLRTPLHAIIGMTEVLLASKLDSSQRAETQVIREAGEALLRLINDLLDLTRIESGKVELARTPFLIDDVLDPAVDLLSVTAAKKGLRLAAWIEPGFTGGLRGDSDRLRQIVFNLAGNAVKFTETGHVLVRVSAGTNPSDIILSIEDTGPGMGAEEQVQLFKPFQRGSAVAGVEGTGLGLAITERLVQAMGGRIAVSSERGVGTTFRVELPLADAEGDGEIPGLIQRLRGRSARLRSADAFMTRAVTASLRSLGVSVVSTPDIPTSVDPDLPMRVSTLCWEGGVDEIPVGALHRRALAQHLLAPELPAPAIPVVPLLPEPDSGSSVLLADDNAVARRVTVALLQRCGYRVEAVDSGRTALARLAQSHFDYVVLDGMMPDLDGWQTVEAIRAGRHGVLDRDVPVLGFSADAAPATHLRWLSCGANASLGKPARQAELSATLSAITRTRNAPQGVASEPATSSRSS